MIGNYNLQFVVWYIKWYHFNLLYTAFLFIESTYFPTNNRIHFFKITTYLVITELCKNRKNLETGVK